MLHRPLLIAIIFLSQVTYAAQPDLKTQVAQQVERIKTISGSSENLFFELPSTSRNDGPISELISYGMDALPYLTRYLADTSLTQAYRIHGSGRKRQVAVNEYILYVINKIAEHNFSPPYDPDGVLDDEALQSRILSWWQENKSKSLLERNINAVNDPDHSNRFSAYQWLGRARAKEGRLPLEQRINALLIGEVNSLKQSEMAACAENLGEIGNSDSVLVVRKVCDYLSYWLCMSYRPIEQGRSGTGSGQISDLFKAYRALATLGFKDEALSHLRELRTKYLNEMEPSTQQEFLHNLEEAERWKRRT